MLSLSAKSSKPSSIGPSAREIAAGVRPRFREGSRARLAHALCLVILLSLLKFGLGMRVLAPMLAGPSRGDAFSANIGSWLAVLAVTFLTVGIDIYALLSVYGRISFTQLGWVKFKARDAIPMGIVTFLLCSSLALIHTSWAADISLTEVLRWTTEYTIGQRFLFLLIGLQSAFTVESLFRGYLQPDLKCRIGAFGSIVLTSVAFALYHVDLRPYAFMNSFLTSCVLGWMRERSGGSLTEAAIGHAMYWSVVGPI